ncbi:hypothetical protein EJ02DRAFT_452636 [Clathrospora elynae]|uniref:Uncharacterized protein n=1 Tax=Clathrospora elynae TaxID=706981 RepID=A0A6A5T5C0_9PLEO|nr:hypothetical protein EJ02DRAFT_452636 [Clathrospora elynae]
MLPPVDPAVLQRNPNFEVLYKDLCTRKLNANVSSRDTKKQRVHDEIRKTLQKTLTTHLSTHLLITSLATLPSKVPDLPPSLHPIIELVTAHLTNQICSSDREILSGDTAIFLDNISTISTALSTQLIVLAGYLSKIADPNNPPSISGLSSRATALHQTATQDLPRTLQASLTSLTNSLSTLLATHSSLLSTSIKILEQTQHGSLSRHTKSSADLQHTRATLLGLQAKTHTSAHPPPAEFVAALKEFKRCQKSGEKALRDRESLARRELELYERAGLKGMRDLAVRKEFLSNDVARTEREINKLERGG